MFCDVMATCTANLCGSLSLFPCAARKLLPPLTALWCVCLLPQMASPVPAGCCLMLAAVVVVYAQRHSQQGKQMPPLPVCLSLAPSALDKNLSLVPTSAFCSLPRKVTSIHQLQSHDVLRGG